MPKPSETCPDLPPQTSHPCNGAVVKMWSGQGLDSSRAQTEIVGMRKRIQAGRLRLPAVPEKCQEETEMIALPAATVSQKPTPLNIGGLLGLAFLCSGWWFCYVPLTALVVFCAEGFSDYAASFSSSAMGLPNRVPFLCSAFCTVSGRAPT